MKTKHIITLIGLFTFSTLIISCSSSEEKPLKEITIKESDIVKKSIDVNGMTCVGCEVTLEKSIAQIEGVVTVKASHTDGETVIEFDSTKTDIAAIRATIKEEGYDPR